ncbi:hypothetical protein FSP39_009953 [Pinctada imbricata]|uniref:HTH CENPB-type domain-containing protein n=1 Tax=Pinctada imbricata TaxID=66713 RepID=A0AA88XQ70_PINIB|nr:hypothetical protein FSP39_009953 [Pinctada imbricata]
MASTPVKRRLLGEGRSQSPSPKRIRKELTLDVKLNLINDAEKVPKVSQKELSLKYGIGQATVSDILKRREEYRKVVEDNTGIGRKRHGSTGQFSTLNEMVHRWFKQARSKNIPISGPILQEKALQFASEIGLDNFKASNGWLESFRSRYSIGHFKVCGESADVDMKLLENYKSNLPSIVAEYSPENVFNADETGLFFRALPDKTLASKGEECKGGKLAKERLTVLLCCSAKGEKLKPFVIGKALNPRCFKHLDKKSFPVTWNGNKKAWMTDALFTEWLQELNKGMKRKNRKIVLFIDNATSHGHLTLSHVTLKFLPANTTSKLQPLDLGIIRAFKARYRKRMIKHLLAKMDEIQRASELCKGITVLNAVYWISKSWEETKGSTIESCFQKAGFSAIDPDRNDDDDSDDDDDIPLAQLASLRSEGVIDINIDDNLQTESCDPDEWENALLSEYQTRDNATQSADSSSDDEACESESCDNDLNHKSVLEMLQRMRNFAIQNDSDYLAHVEELISMTEDKLIKSKSECTQSSLLTFFERK